MLLAVAGAFDIGLGCCIRAISDGVNSAAPVSKVFFLLILTFIMVMIQEILIAVRVIIIKDIIYDD